MMTVGVAAGRRADAGAARRCWCSPCSGCWPARCCCGSSGPDGGRNGCDDDPDRRRPTTPRRRRRTPSGLLRLVGAAGRTPAPARQPRERRPLTVARSWSRGTGPGHRAGRCRSAATSFVGLGAAGRPRAGRACTNELQDRPGAGRRCRSRARSRPARPLGVVSIPEHRRSSRSSSRAARRSRPAAGPGLKTDSRAPRPGRRLGPGRPPVHVRRAVRATSTELRPGDQIEVDHRAGPVHLRRRPGAHQRRARRRDRGRAVATDAGHLRPGVHARPHAAWSRPGCDGDALPRHAPAPRRPPSDAARGRAAPRGLVALLLWSQLLLLATVARHLGRAPVRRGAGLWIGATPVLLAILWKVFENLAVLLPNTL